LAISKFDIKLNFQDTTTRKNALYIGKIEKRRNPHFMLDLAKEIGQHGWSLTLIGQGPLSFEIEKRLANENIPNIIYIRKLIKKIWQSFI